MKTILLHIQDDASLDQRIEAALSLARACAAHLSCIHVTPYEAYVSFDAFGGVFVMSDIMKALDEQEQRLRSRIQDRLSSEDVSWDYREAGGATATQLISNAALADLIVVGREEQKKDSLSSPIGMLGDLLHTSRTPLFIPSAGTGVVDPKGTALIAWNGSYEAANAVRSSVSLLKLAAQVKVVQIEAGSEEDKGGEFPATSLLEYLSRHDIHAELSVEKMGPEDIAATLTGYAEGLDAAYLVMGGYSHSRIGEYLFGGVTRRMLSDATVPILIAH
jgi:nucleotide-binding universal stress UspA family protein